MNKHGEIMLDRHHFPHFCVRKRQKKIIHGSPAILQEILLQLSKKTGSCFIWHLYRPEFTPWSGLTVPRFSFPFKIKFAANAYAFAANHV